MLHGSETWHITRENEVALQQAEMIIVAWMCGIKPQDRVSSKGLREGLGLDDIISVSTTAKQVAMVWACAAKGRQ